MRADQVGDTVDQYRLTGLLARSAQASLFSAIDTLAGSEVVLKIPHPHCEADLAFFSRFEREEQIGRRLEHPHLVKTLTPRAKSRVYIAMERAPGRTLRALLEEHPKLPVDDALALVRQLGEALIHLHAHGIVHRDLKPENIIVDEHGHARIIDFGIALDRSARRLTWSRFSSTIGTPDYMAPEQIEGRRGDERSDLYALGVVAYEMMTGQLPHAAPSAAALLRAKTSSEAKPPSCYVPEIDRALEAILVKALAREPRRRYASAEAMLAQLADPASAPLDDGGMAEAPPASRLRLAAVVALVLAGLSWLTWLSARANEPRPAPPLARHRALSVGYGRVGPYWMMRLPSSTTASPSQVDGATLSPNTSLPNAMLVTANTPT
jgi:serine/threonine-protein kinase